jgi:hypothetical protein
MTRRLWRGFLTSMSPGITIVLVASSHKCVWRKPVLQDTQSKIVFESMRAASQNLTAVGIQELSNDG